MAVVSPLAKFKVVFLGDDLVGKSNIITRYMYDKFHTTYQPTIGIDFWSRTMSFEDTQIQLQLWDTAGHERFRCLIPSYIRDSSTVVIVYDVANQQSFLNTTKWIEEVRKERGSNVIIVLVGNKSDLVDKREVAVEEGDAKAREFGFIFIETSAKARFNIKPLFRKIVAALWGMETPSSTRQEDMVGVNSGNVSSSHVSSSDMSNTQEVAKTNDDNSSENEIKDEDVDDEEKDTKGKGRCECGRVYDDILRRMEEMHKRMEEMHKDMLKKMEDMHNGMLKRMEEMHKGMFRSIIKE